MRRAVGETLRRATGRTMSELLREVLTGPLGIDSGLAVAVMRNGPPAAGLAAVIRFDRLIAETEEHQ
jgi:CubicO group peptidase (beta-lactamase class C family)